MDITSYLLGKQASGGTPNLQNKSLTITENGNTNITADTGYDGLGTVSITTEVSGGGTPEKGFVVNSWDANGYPTKITTYGYTTIPNYMFFASQTNVTSKIVEYVLNEGITTIGSDSFNANKSLEKINIPDTVVSLSARSFADCSKLKKISMKGIVSLGGSIANNSSFNYCSGLKKVWIGSAITDLYSYAFVNCSSIDAFYIDKPRATVEGFSGYSVAFMNNASKQSVIICNDDPEFIDKTTFDNLVVS